MEVQVIVDGELAEPVAEVFGRFGEGAVLLGAQPDDEAAKDAVIVRTYLETGPDYEERAKQIRQGLWHLSQIVPMPPPLFRDMDQEDWRTSWQDKYSPVEIGDRLLIHPPWMELPKTERQIVIIDPGMAFGTGTHPSTRLALALMERHLTPGDIVVDLGCGSGILSIAAIKLGAKHVWAYDNSDSAIEASIENIVLNGQADHVTLRQGSLEELAQDFAERQKPAIIVSNILTMVHTRHLEQGLAELLSPASYLILAGVFEDDEEMLGNATGAAGLEMIHSLTENMWSAYSYKPKPPR